MAALLKDVSEDEDEDEEEKEDSEEEEVEEEEESSEEESESESESDDSDSEKSISEPEDAPLDKKKANLSSRAKRHEARLGALKKGNTMLKTNAERFVILLMFSILDSLTCGPFTGCKMISTNRKKWQPVYKRNLTLCCQN